MPTNQQLQAALKRAKSLNKDSSKRVHFALVLKGSTKGILLASPKRIAPQKIQEAKLQLKSSTVVRGTCFGEGSTLVFEIKNKPVPAWKALVRKLVKTETGMGINPDFRSGKDADEYDEDDGPEPPPDQEQAQEEEPVVESEAEQWKQRCAAVAPPLKYALRLGQVEKCKQLRDRYHEAVSLANQGHYEPAHNLLDMVESLAQEMLSNKVVKTESGNVELYASFTKQYEAVALVFNERRGVDDSREIVELGERLEAVRERTEEDRSYLKGTAALADLERELHILVKTPSPISYRNAFRGKLNAFSALWKQLEGKDQKRAKTFQEQVQHCTQLAKAEQYRAALDELELLEKEVKHSLKTKEWSDSITDGYPYLNENPEARFKCEEAVLGGGSNGTVHRINTQGDVPPLVVKFPVTWLGPEWEAGQIDRELKGYQDLGEHPNLARCLGKENVLVGDEQRTGLVFEQLSSTSRTTNEGLKERLKQGKIKHEDYWGTVQYTLVGMLRGLDHIAGKGFIHGDIKDDNVMFDETGEVKIVDLGEVFKAREQLGQGAPAFMAPELLKAHDVKGDAVQEVTSKADVFSLGAMLYKYGEGENFRGTNPQRVSDHLLKPMDEKGRKPGRYGVQSDYVKFLNWVLTPDPNQRPTIREVLEHPFLKNRLLSDDEARKLIKSVNVPNKLNGEVPQDVPPDPHQAPKPMDRPPPPPHDPIKALRQQLEAVLVRLDAFHNHVGSIATKLTAFAKPGKSVPDYLTFRADFTRMQDLLSDFVPDLDAALKILGKSKPEDPEQRQQDASNLRRLQELQTQIVKSRRKLEDALDKVRAGLKKKGGTKQQAALVRRGQIFANTEINGRIRQLDEQRARWWNAVRKLLPKPDPNTAVDQRLKAIARLKVALRRQEQQAGDEQTNFYKLLSQLETDSKGLLTSQTDKEASKAAYDRLLLCGLSDTLSQYRQSLQKWLDEDLKQAEESDQRQVEPLLGEVRKHLAEVERLIAAAPALGKRFHEQFGAFQAVAKKPRTTGAEQASFAKKRDTYFQELKQLRDEIGQPARVHEALKDLRGKFSPELGGTTDVHGAIEGALGKFEPALRALQRMLTLIASDLNN